MFFAARDALVDRHAEALEDQARLVAAVIDLDIQRDVAANAFDLTIVRLSTENDVRITVIGRDGTVIADSTGDVALTGNLAGRPEVNEARRDGFGSAEQPDETGETRLFFAAVEIASVPGAVVRVASPATELDAAIGRLRRNMAITMGTAVLVAGLVVYALAGRNLVPPQKLRNFVGAVDAGRLDSNVEIGGGHVLDEVDSVPSKTAGVPSSPTSGVERDLGRFEAVLQRLTDGVVLTDRNGEIMQLNEAAERMLGAPMAAAVGRPFVQIARDHELAQLLRRALAGEEPAPLTIEYGLNRRAIRATAQLTRGPRERLGLMVLHDETELRRLETVRREFVANVSHELRTPLASIKALVETLEAGAIDDQAIAADFLGRIVGEVDRLALLVDELLDLARLESGRVALRLEAVSPAEVLTRGGERLRPQIERGGLELRFALPADLPLVRVDPGRIEQVVINLVHNAIKFTPPGGAITIAALTKNGVVEGSVSDTGAGISPEELPRLFERFHKADRARRSEGTGLGLAIVKHIIGAHGGAVSVESELDHGSTFRFDMPLITAVDG